MPSAWSFGYPCLRRTAPLVLDVLACPTCVMLGRVELYRLSLDPTERVDVAAERPDVVARLLPVLQRLVHETARDGALVTGWSERSPPCPRWNRRLNLTEHCCASRSGSGYTK